MKTLLHLIITILLSSMTCSAQYSIKGSVSSIDGQPIPYANVILYNDNLDELIKGVISSDNGTYLFEDVPNGTYFIEVSTLGFKDENSAIFDVSDADQKIDFKLAVDSLNEVVIFHRRPVIKQTAEKLIVDFEKSELVSTNLRDVMKRIPGIIVTNNDLSYAGQSNIRILIDGKNTNYFDIGSLMREIPANNISKVELINQPGAEYDAEGSGPLINIILKKNAKLGTNGSVQTTVGYTNDFTYATNASFSRYKNDLNFQASIGFSESSWREDLLIEREVEDERFIQSSITPENIFSYTSNIRIDLDIDEKNKIGVSSRGLYSISSRNTENLTTITCKLPLKPNCLKVE